MKLTTLTWLTVFGCLICLMAPPAQAATRWIYMDEFGFDPAYLEVTVNDTVNWANVDSWGDPHATYSSSYPWDSGTIPYGYYWPKTYTKTGTFSYYDYVGGAGSGTLVVKGAGPTPVFISAPNRTDMVYDPSRDVLYIASGSSVLRYQVGISSFLTPFQLSGSLMGIDLSPDWNTLMVADSSANSTSVWVHVIDLNTGQTNKVSFPVLSSERGTYAVAFGQDGAALITSRYSGSGTVPLRRYDPATGQTTVIGPGWISMDSMVSASGDLSTIIIAQPNSSYGPFNRYDVASRSIIRSGGDGVYNFECAASRDASLYALPTWSGTFIYNGNFNLVTTIGTPIGAAFHPGADAVFFPMYDTPYVRAYSTTTWDMLAQYDYSTAFIWPGNHAFDTGRVRISPSGDILFVTVSGGVKYLRHGLSLPGTYRLVVRGDPEPVGESTPTAYGTSWLPYGSWIQVSVPPTVETNGTIYVCTGWTCAGSIPSSGTETSYGFSLLANSIFTWRWQPLTLKATIEPGVNQITLQWPSFSGKIYDVLYSTNLHNGFTAIATDLYDSPPTNTYQTTVGSARAGFYRIRARPAW